MILFRNEENSADIIIFKKKFEDYKEAMELDIEETKKTFSAEKFIFEKDIKVLSHQKTILEKKVKNLEEENIVLTNEANDLRLKLKNFKIQIEIIRGEVLKALKEKEEQERENSQVKQINFELETEIQSLRTQVIQYQSMNENR